MSQSESVWEGENQQESIVVLNGSRKQVRVGGSGAPTMKSDPAFVNVMFVISMLTFRDDPKSVSFPLMVSSSSSAKKNTIVPLDVPMQDVVGVGTQGHLQRLALASPSSRQAPAAS